jgi:hypothetical protein
MLKIVNLESVAIRRTSDTSEKHAFLKVRSCLMTSTIHKA